eukprot:551766_1
MTTTNTLTEPIWLTEEEMEISRQESRKQFDLNRESAIFIAKASFIYCFMFCAVPLYIRSGICWQATSCWLFIFLLSNLISPWIFCVLETIKHEYIPQYMNTQPPSFVYELNYKNDNMYQCNICSNPFIRSINNSQETILKCGHRYHQKCLREFELAHIDKDPFFSKNHQCPTCNISYDWNDKWQYKYIDTGIIKMSDTTLMKHLCNDLQNTI